MTHRATPRERGLFFVQPPWRRGRVRRWILGTTGAYLIWLWWFSPILGGWSDTYWEATSYAFSDDTPTQGERDPLESPAFSERNVEMALLVKDFDGARNQVERIVREHKGRIPRLSFSGARESRRGLSASLQIPLPELSAALAELRKVGRLESESQAQNDITADVNDLRARLTDTQASEERLLQAQRRQAGKLGEMVEVERQIREMGDEIRRLKARLRELEILRGFATVQVQLNEEYQAPLEVPPPFPGTRVRNAAVDGYQELSAASLGLLTFLLSAGPTLLFWGLLLFWPARYVWRRWRSFQAAQEPPFSGT